MTTKKEQSADQSHSGQHILLGNVHVTSASKSYIEMFLAIKLLQDCLGEFTPSLSGHYQLYVCEHTVS